MSRDLGWKGMEHGDFFFFTSSSHLSFFSFSLSFFLFVFVVVVLFLAPLWIRPRASQLPSKHSATELHPQPYELLFLLPSLNICREST